MGNVTHNSIGIGVVGEASLDRLDVENVRAGIDEGRGKPSRDKGLANVCVSTPNCVSRVGDIERGEISGKRKGRVDCGAGAQKSGSQRSEETP